jgi:DNA polymerase-3 subunit gamma/tau
LSYLVLARKWRPQTFGDLVGQEHVCRTLQNAIGSGRVAHAFLFTGARGVGKTSAARILAKALECERGPASEPCNECPSCTAITAGNSVDVFEIDGASNTGVEDIRELRENIKYLPSTSRFKIFIIDEVHMLSTTAFNALLKTLEEPPPHVKFIFATTEPHKVPVTILSRCQRFDFRRISLQKISQRLRLIAGHEAILISDASLTAIARKGDGSMRDSLSTLDQVLAFCGDEISDEDVTMLLGVVDRRLLLDASGAVFAGDCKGALDVVRRVDDCGYNMRHFCRELIAHFRNLAFVGLVDDPSGILDLAEGELTEIKEQAAGVEDADLHRHIGVLLKAEGEMAQSAFPRLILEIALIRMCRLVPVVPVNDILDRLKCLESLAPGETKGNTSKHDPPAPRETSGGKPRDDVPPAAVRSKTPEAPSEVVSSAGVTLTEPGDWPSFAASVKRKKMGLGSMLEHGRPLAFSAERITLGFPAGSFYFSSLRDPDSMRVLKELAQAHFKASPVIEVVPLPADGEDLPPTILEKKSLEEAEREGRLRRQAAGHPIITAAIEIFGGEISEVVETADPGNGG